MAPPEIALPATRATLIEDSFEGEIDRKGHGLQRALVVTLLQHLAMTVPQEPEAAVDGNGERATGSESQPPIIEPDLILAIEEPELYLHPSRARYLSKLLQDLSEKPDLALGSRNQVLYTTHSPYFVGLERFDQIRMVSKRRHDAAAIPQSVATSYTLDAAKGELARVADRDPSDFTRKSFIARARPVMTSIVNEGFFADVVVVVEGASDVAAVWKMQEILGRDWERLGVAVVPAGGKNNLDRPTVVFRGFGIPVYFVFDSDSNAGDRGSALVRVRSYLRMAEADVSGFPTTQAHETWAVMDPDLEGAIEAAVGAGLYRECRAQVAVELVCKQAGVTKNIEGMARLVELLYEKGETIPVLEEVVDLATALHPDRS